MFQFHCRILYFLFYNQTDVESSDKLDACKWIRAGEWLQTCTGKWKIEGTNGTHSNAMFVSWSIWYIQLGKVNWAGKRGCNLLSAINFLVFIRSLRRLVGNGDELSRNGFIEALQDIQMDCTEDEAAEIFTAFDTNGNGHINMHEFLLQLRLMSLVNMHWRIHLK